MAAQAGPGGGKPDGQRGWGRGGGRGAQGVGGETRRREGLGQGGEQVTHGVRRGGDVHQQDGAAIAERGVLPDAGLDQAGPRRPEPGGGGPAPPGGGGGGA